MSCTVEGCTRTYAAKGFCHLHYNRWQRHGSPEVARRMATRGGSLNQRVRELTDRSDGPDACWPFIGSLHHSGYAYVKFEGKYRGLHVWALIEATGEDRSAEFDALHSCDNRACANPRHLRWGTLQQNMDDKVARGRQSRLGGEDHPCAVLTWDAVRSIRSRPDDSLSTLAVEFGVSKSLIHLIRRNERWKVAA